MITGILLGILVFQAFLFVGLAACHAQVDKLVKLLLETVENQNKNQTILNDTQKSLANSITSFFDRMNNNVDTNARLPGDEWKDIGEDSNE